MSTIFDFVMKNANILEEIYSNEKGEISVEPSEFDFGHDDVVVDVEEADMVFSVSVGDLKLVTRVNIDNMGAVSKFIKDIKDPNKRESVIEMIEDSYRGEAESSVETARERVADAQVVYDAAKQDFDTVVDALGDLKKNWNIP